MSEFHHLFPLLLQNEQLNERQQAQFVKWAQSIDKKPSASRTSEEWFVLGVKAQLTNDFDEAEFTFSEAIKKDAAFEAAYQRRGAVYTELGDAKLAEADFSKALQIDPEFVQAYLSRSVLYTEQGAYEKALADIGFVLDKEPEHAGAIVTKAAVFEYQEQYDEAADALNPLIEKYPKDAELLSKRALYRLFGNKPQEALADFNNAAKFSTGNSVSDFNYGLVYGVLENHTKDAYQRFEKAFRKNPAILRQYKESAKKRDFDRLVNKLKEVLAFQKTQNADSGKFYRDQLIDLLERMLRDFN